MESFGSNIRKLRIDRGLPLRTVAAYLKIDQAILSKIERGQRKAPRAMVFRLSKYFKVNENDLMVTWLSDKLAYELEDEADALTALRLAEEKVIYRPLPKLDDKKIFKIINNFLKKDGRAAKAWVFGSFARGDYTIKSDIDLMVRFKKPDLVSLFDYADIAYQLERLVNIKVDIVEEGYLQPFAYKTAQQDLKLIYG